MSIDVASELVAEFLHRAKAGDQAARSQAFQYFEAQLRRMAESRLCGEDKASNSPATCLAHDAFLKLINTPHVHWTDQRHFLAFAARAMRQILVDQARFRKAQKRGRGIRPQALAEGPEPCDPRPTSDVILEHHEKVLAIERALSQLLEQHRDLAEVVILNFYAGFSQAQIARILNASLPTVKSRLARAKNQLHRVLRHDSAVTTGTGQKGVNPGKTTDG